ncbi:hypothetical protein QE152_g14226 [Popillia japonica]|uniref:Uncharacterized protein n=1 Tax=Popillia japonica TaxID=7064 RepID=A0AAW1LA78_POPJA
MDAIDAVYIPPEVDILTDEENIDDETPILQERSKCIYQPQMTPIRTNLIHQMKKLLLTDEENIDDEYIPTENLSQDPDIAGTFEMHLPTADDADTDEFDSSDEETLASKK